MKKHDLGLFMLVEYRRGDVRMVVSDYDENIFLVGLNGDWEPLSSYDDNLIHRSYAELDIVRVFDHGNMPNLILNFDLRTKELLWEREGCAKVKEMTMEELTALLGYKVRIIK